MRRLLLSGSGLVALGLGMALGAGPALASGSITGPANGPVPWSDTDLTITSGGTIGSSATGVIASGTLGTLLNSGTITDLGSGAGILNLTGSAAAISNLAGGTIVGAGWGVRSGGSIGLLSNSGLITSSGAAGVANGGAIATLSNDLGGTITSSAAGSVAAGVYNSGSIGALSNSGLISGSGAYGVINTGGQVSQLTNASGGSIFGQVTGVWNNGQIGTLSNAGSISAFSGAGVRNLVSIDLLQNSGSIGGSQGVVNNGHIGTLSNTGLIDGGTVGLVNSGGTIDLLDNSGTIAWHGVQNSGAIGAIVNSGMIGGAHAIDNAGTIANLTNAAGGRILSPTTAVASSGSIGTLSNYGQITGDRVGVATSGAARIDTLANEGGVMQSSITAVDVGSNTSISAVANNAGGVIHGGADALINDGKVGWIGNVGLITSDAGHAVANGGDLGILYNEAAGTISAAGGGSAAAVYVTGTIGTINNSGVITAPSAYGVIVTGGVVGTINSQGAISGGNTGVWNNGSIGLFTNGGTITGGPVAVRNLVSMGTLDSWGVISGATGVRNDGTIGSVINRGTIQAANAAVDDAGRMGTLNNSGGGFLQANIGVRVSGALGELDNAGYIISPSRAVTIASGGSLGVLSNTGVIEGVIENAASGDLTIAGGTGAVYGTLTGLGGAQSTILNSASDLHMSGNLVLDDEVMLGSRTLFSSANLQMSRDVKVTGNFSQNGGSLMFGVASPSNYARLLFAGPAQVNIANAGVGLIPASNGVLAIGQSYTVVQAPAGAIAINNDTAQVAGFTGVVTNTGHNLVLSLIAPAPTGHTGQTPDAGGSSAGPSGGSSGSTGGGSGFPSGGQNTGGSSGVGGALNTIANGPTPAAQAFNSVVIPVLVGLSPAAQAQAITQLGAATLGLEVSLNGSKPVSNAVAGQQARFTAQAQGRAYAALDDDYYGEGAGGGERGLWGRVLGGTADGSAQGGAPFSASLGGVAIGADLLRTDQAYGGLAASWVKTWAAGKGPQSAVRMSFDSYQVSAYGSLAPRAYGGRLSVDAMVGVAWNRYDQERAIAFLGSAARASYDGEQYMGRLTVGYAFTGNRVTFTPYAGIEENHLVAHGYVEHGAGLADLSVAGKTADTFRHDIGVKMEGAWDLGGGSEILPSLKLGWGHTYDNGPVTLYSSLAGVSFASPAARPAADGALIGAGLVLRQAGRMSVGLEYQGDLRRDFQAHTGAVRLTVRF